MKNFTMAAIIVTAVLVFGVGLLVFKTNKNSSGSGDGVNNVQQGTDNPAIQNNEPTKEPVNQGDDSGTVEKTFQSAISLTVSSPVNGLISTSPTVLVKGKTLPNADVAVNDSDLKADASGAFSVSIKLDEGDNVIVVIANDDQGNVAEKEITVTYTP